jgi:hypothetical protein
VTGTVLMAYSYVDNDDFGNLYVMFGLWYDKYFRRRKMYRKCIL